MYLIGIIKSSRVFYLELLDRIFFDKSSKILLFYLKKTEREREKKIED